MNLSIPNLAYGTCHFKMKYMLLCAIWKKIVHFDLMLILHIVHVTFNRDNACLCTCFTAKDIMMLYYILLRNVHAFVLYS